MHQSFIEIQNLTQRGKGPERRRGEEERGWRKGRGKRRKRRERREGNKKEKEEIVQRERRKCGVMAQLRWHCDTLGEASAQNACEATGEGRIRGRRVEEGMGERRTTSGLS